MRYDLAFAEAGFHSALLTTFSIDTHIFENIALPPMRAAGCRNIGVMVDLDRLNHQLAEFNSADRAGLVYQLSKIKVRGAFHPKIILQLGRERGRLIVGSGNLTGAGMITNLEAATVLTVGPEDMRAAPILATSLRYFQSHVAQDDVALSNVIARARAWTPWLDDVVEADEVDLEGARLAFLTEAEVPIGERFRHFLDGDRIERMVFVSPFWDADLSGMNRLRTSLGKPSAALIVDPKEQDFDATTILTQERVTLHSAQALLKERSKGNVRRLHAKIIIAMGEKADYVLSGSANASVHALYGAHRASGNAEACLLRMEEKGTAIERLGLSACLSETMPVCDMKRRAGMREVGPEALSVIDGGAMRFENERLIWTPPSGVDPRLCQVTFKGVHTNGVPSAKPSLFGNSWVVPLPDEVAVERLGHAVIAFEDGSSSAPIPVAFVDRLAYEGRPAAKGRVKALLDQIALLPDIDAEMFDLASKLFVELTREEALRASASLRRSVPLEDATSTPVLSELEFGRIAEARLVPGSLGSQPLLDLQRIMNRHLGLSPWQLEGDIDEADDVGGGGSNGGSQKGFRLQRQTSPSPIARKNAKKLVVRVRATCDALRQGSNPLVYLNCIRLHLLVNALLVHAAPVGKAATDQRPLHASDKKIGWIRSLGMLLLSLQAGLERPSSVQQEKVDGEMARLDMLGTALFSAGISLDAARREAMPAPVIRQFEALNAALAKIVHEQVAHQPDGFRRVERRMAALQSKHGHLAAAR